MREALKGVTLLEVGTMTPGKYAGFLLTGWGARSLRVERPGPGGKISGEDLVLNRGKRSMAVNLQAPEGREILLRLAASADVLMESYRPGVATRLGIDYPAVRRVNERIVYCSLSGFGQTGPDRLRPAFDLIFQAESGLSHLLAGPGGPVSPRTYLADAVSGLMAALAIAVALRQREAAGRGEHIDLSMLESVFSLLSVSHGAVEAADDGDRAAYGIFKGGDGRFIALGAAREASCRTLFTRLGRPDLAETGMMPGAKGQEAADFLRDAFAGRPAAVWVEELSALDVEIAPVNTPAEAFSSPQLIERAMVVDVPDPRGGHLRQIGIPATGPGGDPIVPAPAAGRDTEAVLRELGYGDGEIAGLRSRQVI